jgi:hypothetical protein
MQYRHSSSTRPTRCTTGRVIGAAFVLATTTALAGTAAHAGGTEFRFAEDFEGEVSGEWSAIPLQAAPTTGLFFGRLGSESVTLDLTGIGEHSILRVTFDLHILGTMDGSSVQTETVDDVIFSHGPDVFRFDLDDTTLLETTFSNVPSGDYNQAFPNGGTGLDFARATGSFNIGQLGYTPNSGNSYGDTTYRLAFLVPHTADTATLSFGASGLLTEPGTTMDDDESWGFDNLAVSVCENLCADPNGDGETKAADALHTLRSSVGTASCALCVCDVNKSGSVTASDALQTLRVAVGVAPKPNCEIFP